MRNNDGDLNGATKVEECDFESLRSNFFSPLRSRSASQSPAKFVATGFKRDR